MLSCLVDWWKSNELVNEIVEDVWILWVILVHQISLQFNYPSNPISKPQKALLHGMSELSNDC